MPLRLTLKPNERVIIGGAVIQNGDHRSGFLVENEVPVLRDADILSPGSVQTGCERIYLALQLFYVDPANAGRHRRTFEILAAEAVEAAPSCSPYVQEIVEHLDADRGYQALKSAQHLLQHEKELIDHVL